MQEQKNKTRSNITSQEKDFDSWNNFKKITENKNRPIIKEGDIWWCRMGLNIGVEEDGKGENFRRPVLVLKKYSSEIVFVVPLTSQNKNSNWYNKFSFKGKEQTAVLNQARPIDVKRLDQFMGQLSFNTLREIKEKFLKLLE